MDARHSHLPASHCKIQHLFPEGANDIIIYSLKISHFSQAQFCPLVNQKQYMNLSLNYALFAQISLLLGIITLLFKHHIVMESQQHRQTKLRNSSQLRSEQRGDQKRWGKYRAIMGKNNKGQPLLTLGPNFITLTVSFITLNLFTILFLYRLRNIEETSSFFLILTFNIIFVDLAWLTTAFINPGISTPCPQEQGQICEECLAANQIEISKKMNRYHCQQCEICIDQQEAHLRLLGCCIGKKNFLAFKVFLLAVFLWGLSMITIIPMTYNL